MLFHNKLVLGFLAVQLVLYLILIFPWPLSIRKRIVHFLTHSKLAKKLWKAQSILILIVTIFLVESYNQFSKMDDRLDVIRGRKLDSEHHGVGHHHEEIGAEYQEITIKMKLFSAQRNCYLHVFTLFLTIVLNR